MRDSKSRLTRPVKALLYSTSVLSMFVFFGGRMQQVHAGTNPDGTGQTQAAAKTEAAPVTDQTQPETPASGDIAAEAEATDDAAVEASPAATPKAPQGVSTTETTPAQDASTATPAAETTPKATTETPAAEPEDPATDPAQAAALITSVVKKDTYYEVTYANGLVARLSLLEGDIMRYYADPTNTYGDPAQSGKNLNAKILTKTPDEYGPDAFNASTLTDNDTETVIDTGVVQIHFNKIAGTMSVTKGDKTILAETQPIELTANKSTEYLARHDNENYFGGGTQNGDFALLGENVKIEKGGWTDGESASPVPFYWSTDGYGVLRNTFTPGAYNFDTANDGSIKLSHNENRFDAFYVFADTAQGLIKGYYELTGAPLMMPEYGFYEAHLNAFNRDVWIEVPEGTRGAYKFPDGKFYKEYNPENMPENLKGQGILESLNGEGTNGQDNYQFSARQMIDLYEKYDMPLGWFLPNDGYGAGYGQTDTLAGNVENLKQFIEYANAHGIEVGLWTQQNLSPVDPDNPTNKDRDFAAEVAAGVVALKTDVAWVGAGYSFGLDGIQKALDMMESVDGDTVRPFVITLHGWAGTQRMSGIWDGDQTGGEWEYIRFHIPTYIGEGLSGQPNVGSDTDGIYGGNNPIINAREYEWKTFTPIELNMDGWGSQQKMPWVYSDAITAINRAYLKQKTMLMPYIYTTSEQAISDGNPMVRALLLEYPDLPETYTDLVQYEYMWGDNFLIAPIYQNTASDADGNDIRNGIYLPDPNQIWIDYYTGKEYQGGQVINNFDAPLWKLPVFVKAGAIIPTAPATNNATAYDAIKDQRQFQIYANGDSSYTVYEDDGLSAKYQSGASATTKVTSSLKGTDLTLTVAPTVGTYAEMKTNRTTEFDVRTKTTPSTVTATIGGQTVTLKQVQTLAEFEAGTDVWFDDTNYLTNSYLDGVGTDLAQHFLRLKLHAVDVTKDGIEGKISGIDTSATPENPILTPSDAIATPNAPTADPMAITTTEIPVTWNEVEGATGYNLKVDGVLYRDMKAANYTIDHVLRGTSHTIQVQTVTADGVSQWSDEATFETSNDPLRDVLKVVKAEAKDADGNDAKWQSNTEFKYLFDGDTTTMAHSAWNLTDATPMSIYAYLDGDYALDSIVYTPRDNGGNGNLKNMNVYVSDDGITWTKAGSAQGWKQTAMPRSIQLAEGTHGSIVRFDIPKGAGVNNNVSGNEIQIFKVPGALKQVPGDISGDGQISDNDIQSLKQYSGLNDQDAAFDQNGKKGDIDGSGVVDAADANFILGQLGETPAGTDAKTPAGTIALQADRTTYQPGDTVTLTVTGYGLSNVNALSVALPVDPSVGTVTGITGGKLTAGMENLSRVATHTDGSVEAYLMFANKGEQPRLASSGEIATITLKLNANLTGPLQLALVNGELVNQKSPVAKADTGTGITLEQAAVDLTALAQSVKIAGALDPADYTADSFAAVTQAKAAGEALIATPDTATQANVVQAQADLVAAIEGLTPVVPVDTTVLAGLIKTAQALDPAVYTPETSAALNDALTAAKAIGADATQAAVDQASLALATALADLTPQTSPAAVAMLNQLVEAAGKVDTTPFTAASAQALAAALTAGQQVAANPKASDADLTKAAAALSDALAGLKLKAVVNKAALQLTVANVAALETQNYLPSSFAPVTKALAAAKQVLADSKADQAAVDQSIVAIVKALATLQPAASRTAKADLQALIDQTNQLDANAYTAASYAPALDAAAAAEALLTDGEATPAQVAAAQASLQAALAGLTAVKATTDETTQTPTSEVDDRNQQRQSVETGQQKPGQAAKATAVSKATKATKATKAVKANKPNKAAETLPATGNTHASWLTALGLSLMSLLGLAGINRKRL